MAQELYASVDLGGTKIACAFADAEGHIVAEDRAPTESYEGPENVLKRIARLINDLAEQVGQRPAAVGMAVPGLADLPNGVTLF
ncbi:MAG: ROK family protein, partial [Chloroflexi bacterium]|nr:ROK family protein [Chloroflexota bacterium]